MLISVSKVEELIERLKNDDKAAFDEIFNYYYPRLYNFSKRILKIEDEIDDILQNVFLKIWLNRYKINNPETFNSFIFTITRNALLNLIRLNANNQAFKEEFSKRIISSEYVTQNYIEFREIKTAIDQIIYKLPEKRQKIFLLSRNEGLSHNEIAQKLNISEKTVEDHITHSIRFLKKSLSEIGILSLLYFYLFL
jgi:RNA polymerase sigma-70 factor, ECF subfamily